MIGKILRIWRSITAIGTLIGILYLPSDIKGLPQAIGIPDGAILRTWNVVVSIERETWLVVFVTIMVLWIVWIDVRPLVVKYFRKYKRFSFSIFNEPYCESTMILYRDGKQTEFIENVFYMIVGNNIETGKTLKNVRANLFHLGLPIQLKFKNTDDGRIDIRHGEYALFRIGRIVLKDFIGSMYTHGVIEEDDFIKAYKHNIPLGHVAFEFSSVQNDRESSIGFLPQHPNIWKAHIVISADEIKSEVANIDINMAEPRSLSSIVSVKRCD